MNLDPDLFTQNPLLDGFLSGPLDGVGKMEASTSADGAIDTGRNGLCVILEIIKGDRKYIKQSITNW